MFIVGSGLSTLETAANPFIATCGPPRYSELRLNLAQAVQAAGSVLAPLLASRVIFKNVNDKSLTSVQWVYLGVACFVFLLAIVFFFAPIPEITDADMALQAEESAGDTGFIDKPFRKQYTLFFGSIAQFCYVGAQVAIAGNFIKYTLEVAGYSGSRGSDQLAIAQALYAIGRGVGGVAMNYIKPRIMLMVFMTAIIIFIAAAIGADGNAAVAMLCLVLFFESIIFPTIFTLSLRGLGRHTKRGGSFLVSAISGGAVFPVILGSVADRGGPRAYRNAMCVPLGGFVVAWAFPIYLNIFCREMLDGFRATKIGLNDNEGTIKAADVDEKSIRSVRPTHVEVVPS
jgi:MFS transporter, FHS family, L-fucose permease